MPYNRGFKGKRRRNDPTYKPYDPNYHPQSIIALMSQGLFNCEIMDEWCISESTFKRWRAENAELKEAYEIGLPKRKAYFIREKLRPMMDGKLEGKHSFNALKFIMEGEGEYQSQSLIGQGSTTHINIGNMNVLQEKSTSELLEHFKDNIKFLTDNKVLTTEYKVLDDRDSESNKHNEG